MNDDRSEQAASPESATPPAPAESAAPPAETVPPAPAPSEASGQPSGGGAPDSAPSPSAADDARSAEGNASSGDSADGPADGSADGDAPKRKRRRRRRRRKPREDGADSAGEAADGDVPDGAVADGGAEGAAPSGTASSNGEANEASSAAGSGEAGGGPRSAKKKKAKRPSKKKKPRREDTKRPNKSAKSGRHQATTAVRSLSAMAQQLLDVEGVDHLARPRSIQVTLDVPLDPGADGTKEANSLVEQLLKRVQEVREHESALEPGHVYCYFSESAKAGNTRPTDPRHVFEGFQSTGRPTFADFVTLSIDRRDPGIDELAEGADLVVTHVSMGRVLRTQQLVEFGKQSPVYRILGQVDAGLYALMGSADKAAFSFQLLLGATLDGKPRFRLHWVGGADLRDVADPAVGQILTQFQRRLDRESLRYQGVIANGETPDEEEFVLPILQELAKRLAGRARRSGRRTDHAQQRSEEGQRPTTKAFADARDAADDRILRDDVEGTMVVVGPKNRVHVFGAGAKHVTSFMLTGSNVRKRMLEGRWHPAEPEERGEFRLALKQQVRDEESETASES